MSRKARNASLEDLQKLLEQLNLTTVARELPALLSAAESDAPSFSDFLGRVLDVEQAARFERKIQRRVRWSRLGPYVDLEGFDFAARPQLCPQAVKELMTCRFVQDKRNLILVGRPSLGKSRVARSIGHAACRKALSVYYGKLSEILAALHASKADGTYRKAFRRVTAPDLLILDDCGFDTELGKAAANELFHLVCARYQARSSIVVTNLPFRKWEEFLPSPAQAVAIADRLVDDATILRFTGRPFRQPREILGAPLEDE